jgi:hypothetical protein
LNAIQKFSRTNVTELSNLYVTLSETEVILFQIPEAILSESTAIDLDITNHKSHMRCATADSESMALLEVFDDFEAAPQIQRGESYLRERMEKARRKLFETESLQKPLAQTQMPPLAHANEAALSSPCPASAVVPHSLVANAQRSRTAMNNSQISRTSPARVSVVASALCQNNFGTDSKIKPRIAV